MPTTVVNLKGRPKPKGRNWQPNEILVENEIYIGRRNPWLNLPDSIWLNPRKLPRNPTPEQRADAIAYYEHEHLPSNPELLAQLPTLRGKRIACWCAPLPCHGDVLARLADAS